MANDFIQLWGRLGIQLSLTPEEFEQLQKDDLSAKDLLVDLIKSDRCFISGDTYFPEATNEELLQDDLEFDLNYEPIQKNQDALGAFIEQEVPFRLKEILELDASDEMVRDLIDEVNDNTDVMFNYNRFDQFLEEKYQELNLNALTRDADDLSYESYDTLHDKIAEARDIAEAKAQKDHSFEISPSHSIPVRDE